MCHSLRLTLISLSLTVGLGAQSPSCPGQTTSSTVEVELTTSAPPVPLREALGLAEKAIFPLTHHVVKAELRAIRNRSYWALLFGTNAIVDDGATWVTVDMERHVIVHGTVIKEGPEPNLNQIPFPQPHPATIESKAPETLTALPVDWKALSRLKGPQTFSHDGRIFRLDLTGWEWIFICDGPHVGPDGVHVLGTYGKALPGVDREVYLTIWLLPRSPMENAPFDPLPQTPERVTERRLIAMGGQPGTLHLTSFERRLPSDPAPRNWYVSAELAGPGWHLWLQVEGTLRDPGALVQEVTRLASSLRRVVGMPPSN